MGNIRSVPVVDKTSTCDIIALNGMSAISSMEGWRRGMEDTHILINMNDYMIMGLFDGHGGDRCSLFCKDNFLKIFLSNLQLSSTPDSFKVALIETFKQLDEQFKSVYSQEHKSGTTALVAIITNTHYIIANAGDSRGIIIDKHLKCVLFSTTDHKPNNTSERLRIERTNHSVSMGRVDGNLATSRAIGDYEYKDGVHKPEEYAVTCVPDVTIIEKKIDTVLLLACDGIWDVLSNDSIVQYVLRMKEHIFTKLVEFDSGSVCTLDRYYKNLSDKSISSESDSNPIAKLCEHIIDVAFDLDSKDNFTVAIYSC
jgi:serine/threonine protein phosphatase PrpC